MQQLKAVVRFLLDYGRWIPVLLLYLVSCYLAYFSIRYLDTYTTVWLCVTTALYPFVWFIAIRGNISNNNRCIKHTFKETLCEENIDTFILFLVLTYLWPILLVAAILWLLWEGIVTGYRKLDIWAHDETSYYVYKLFVRAYGQPHKRLLGVYNTRSEAKLAEKAWDEEHECCDTLTLIVKVKRNEEEK